MTGFKGEHICIKFSFKLEKSATKTLEILKAAFGELTMGRRQHFEWLSKFKSGLTSVENAECLGPTSVGTRYENMQPETDNV
jgi:hypothetical protein